MAAGKKVEEHKVAEAAFQMWEAEGKPDGMAVEHWHRARALLEAKETFAEAPEPAAKPKAPAKPKAAAEKAAAPKAAAKPKAPKAPKA